MNKVTLATLAMLVATTTSSVVASEIEIKEWEKTNFKNLDSNNDGSLDSTEMRGTTKKWMDNLEFSEEKQIKMTNNKFNKYDVNKDQKVSLEELLTGNRKASANKKKK